MATQEVDACLSRIFALQLYGSTEAKTGSPPIIILSELAKDLEAEAGPDGPKPVLDATTLDRALIVRLIESPPENYPQPPVHYLLGCYERSSQELRQGGSNAQIQAAVAAARDLILNYAGLTLFAGIVPQPPAAAARGSLQLLDALLLRHGLPPSALAAAAAGGAAAGAVALPAGFLEELAARHAADEGLAEAAVAIVVELSRLAARISPLGDPMPHLASLAQLLAIEPLARAVTACRQWLPKDMRAATGRSVVLPGACWLGPFFGISPIPDDAPGATPREPSVAQQCFAGLEGRRPGDVRNAMSSLQLAMRGVTGQLHAVVQTLLKKGAGPKAATVRWLGGVLDGNAGRAKMQVDYQQVAPDGFAVNVAAVLLKLCGPFLDPSSALFWRRVDAGFVATGGLIDYSGETKLAAGRDEEAAWRERVASNQQAGSSGGGGGGSDPSSPREEPGFHFICQTFFLAAHALHLGPVRVARAIVEDSEELSHTQRWLRATEQALEGGQLPAHEAAVARVQIPRVKAHLDAVQASLAARQAVLYDPGLVTDMLAFYRLMAVWLMRLANPTWQPGAATTSLTLPDPPPPEFTCMPEYFLEDMADLLLHLGRAAPHLLSSGAAGSAVRLDELALMFTAFLGAGKHIRSAFLRSKLSEVLEMWLPSEEEADGAAAFRRRPASASAAVSGLAPLLSCHPAVVCNLGPALVRLYNDIEHTERPGAFYFKFNMRVTIARVLRYLWAQHQHRSVLVNYISSTCAYRGEAERFANMLLNDATYLLDESLGALRKIREAEDKQAAEGGQLSREDAAALQQNGRVLMALLRSATSTIDTLKMMAEETETAKVLLQPHMVGRLADTLNYFLKYLTGPERRQLRISNPDRYNFKPRELLSDLISVYLAVSSHDRGGAFAAAVGHDQRSFRPDMFAEAAAVLAQFGLLDPSRRAALELLAQRALAAAAAAEAEEGELGEEVPEEFACAIMATLMKDPVLLPSGVVVDRPSIQRHLLTDPMDPFSRLPLSEDQLQPATEVAEKIRKWRAERRRGAGGAAAMEQ